MTNEEALELVALANQQKAKRAADMPTVDDALNTLNEAYTRLKELGWNDACYAPYSGKLEFIEAGSSGIHKGSCFKAKWATGNRGFWIYGEGDLWPSRPILFRQVAIEGGAA